MSEAMGQERAILNGVRFDGVARISEASSGMITLRGAQNEVMSSALGGLGLGLPAMRRIEAYGAGQVGWMSPDEVLILCPYAAVNTILTGLGQALAGTHYLAVDVSDARAVFRIDGEAADQVLAKLSPADLLDGQFPLGELRRTRLAQIPAAFWRDEAGFTLICFRSVADYAFDVLCVAARHGTRIDA